jgi:hypothetical protein
MKLHFSNGSINILFILSWDHPGRMLDLHIAASLYYGVDGVLAASSHVSYSRVEKISYFAPLKHHLHDLV